MFRINLGHKSFPLNLCQSMIMLAGRKRVSEYVVTLACCERKSLILLVKYFFNRLCTDSTMFVLHNLLLHRTQNCTFKILHKLGKFIAHNFEPLPIINICFLRIRIHDILSCKHDRLNH